ncbi:hypothetical protein AWE51_15265 [Aquimarina aggregata]|uniref:Baseplate protein J-like domain-containing protein n=1 Tax=Aquimarina aggregata TaxID=1642818 RepID=A0A162Y5S1_9FLAO|nr:type VI secretion system baseplate subunit TssF [Aquimarina aggregata]KZS38939.1 hypothetical protein AWE51_15265 [Aquimarina aggregata]
MSKNTKEYIKNRMMKKAASLWDVPVNEIGDSFDPLISLLLSACASELEKLSGEIDDSHIRITERLIQLMTPLTAYTTKPAHGIAYCESIEPETIISTENQLYYKERQVESKSGKQKNIFFSPTQKTKLVDARVKSIITSNKIFSFPEKKTKELAQIFDSKLTLENDTLYLGIEADHKNVDIKDVSFYFEYLGITDGELFYHHLRNASWYVGEQKLEVIDGYYNSNEIDQIDLDAIFNGTASKTNNICVEVNEFYKKHFVTIQSQKKISDFPDFPEIHELKKAQNDIDIEEDLKWIKIKFSSVLGVKSLEQLFCSINTFPVLNRKSNNLTYQLKNFINIIPVLSEDPFLEIKSIENSNGESYKLEHMNNDNGYKGSYSIRNSNVGKLDSREARQYIINLLELLKDESAAFTFFNHEFLQNNLNSLNQTIALLEKKIEEISDDSVYKNYVYLNPFSKNESISLTYWTTNGEDANHIKSGKNLDIYKGSNLKSKSSYLVTSSFGGSSNLTMEERLQAYRRISLTKNKIVTEEDIKAVCYELYGKNIEKVEVKKGFTTSISLNKGLIQCIEIIMTPSKDVNLYPYEWEYMNVNLLTTLKKQAVNIFPFKIVIKDEYE